MSIEDVLLQTFYIHVGGYRSHSITPRAEITGGPHAGSYPGLSTALTGWQAKIPLKTRGGGLEPPTIGLEGGRTADWTKKKRLEFLWDHRWATTTSKQIATDHITTADRFPSIRVS